MTWTSGPPLARSARRFQASPNATFNVIVQGSRGEDHGRGRERGAVGTQIEPGRGVGLRDRFRAVNRRGGTTHRPADPRPAALRHQGDRRRSVILSGYSSSQRWPWKPASIRSGISLRRWNAPTIAIVDSGIQASHADFGGRVIREVNLASIQPNSAGDGRGHGTLVAAVAAGGRFAGAGASPGRRSSPST